MKLSASAGNWVTRGLIAVFLLAAGYELVTRLPASGTSTTASTTQPVATVATIPNASSEPPTPVSISAKIDWNAKGNGDHKKYIVGNYSILLSSGKDKDGTTIPVLEVDYPGYPHLRFEGQPGFDVAAAKVEVLKLDPSAGVPSLIFATYSGGAHCCTSAEFFQPAKGQWLHDEVGGDGEPFEELPKDVDGDQIPDIELSDGQFLYTFASYAESSPPPMYFNFTGGKLMNVSAEPRYVTIFRRFMLERQAQCLLHSNGACATFVAIASRLGVHDWAWDYVTENYDRNYKWEYTPRCDIDPGKNPCPKEHQHATTYPEALAKFLVDSGYWNESDQSDRDLLRPGFDCTSVTSQVLTQVCSDKTLAGLDRTLGAAYYAAKESSPSPEALKDDQISWISQRNNGASDPGTLAQVYGQRIAALTSLARQQAEAQAAKLSAGGR